VQLCVVQLFNHTLARRFGLPQAERNSLSTYAVSGRRIQDQTSPPATDVKQMLSPAQAEFPAYIFQLAVLGRIEVSIVTVSEIPARVNHLRVKP